MNKSVSGPGQDNELLPQIRHGIPTGVQLPRTYAASMGWRSFMIVAGLALIGAGVAGIWSYDVALAKGAAASAQLSALFVAFIGFGAHSIAYILKYRVVLYLDAIEVFGAFSSRRLRLDDIVGRRQLRKGHVHSIIVLHPKQATQKALKISMVFKTDSVFQAWLSGIPDLDVRAAQDFEAAVLANTELGSTPDERKQKLNHARQLSRILNGFGLVIAGWGFLYPRPYALAMTILALLPWAGIILVARSHGLYQTNRKRADPRFSLSGIIIGPAIVLGARALADFHIFDWPQALGLTCVGATVVIAVMLEIDPGMRKLGSAITLLFVAAWYAYGATVQADVLLDHSRALRFTATVLGKHVARGRSTTWVLSLGSWGPRQEAKDTNVTRGLWDQIQVGGQVCVYLSHGALGVRWFSLRYCGGPYEPVRRPDALQLEPVPAGTPRAWALATVAMIARRNHERIDLLAGNDITPQTVENTKELLGTWWGITNRQQLLVTLASIDHGSSLRRAFEEMGREVDSLPDDEFDKRLKKAEGDKQAHRRLSIVRKYSRVFGSKSLRGWDYVRYVALCRWGFLVGYLSYEDAWERVMYAATILQRTFSSWQDLGQNYLVGREFWSSEETTHDGEAFSDAYAWLLSDQDSPWKQNPWNMSLAASPNQ